MSKGTKSKFTQHLYLMGDRFDAQVAQWFKGAVIIEYDLSQMSHGNKFFKLGKLCGVSLGHQVTKVTEIIGGPAKGVTLAKLSGAYPVVLSSRSAYERGLITRILELFDYVQILRISSERYVENLYGVVRYTHGLKGSSAAELNDIADAIHKQHCGAEASLISLIKQSIRSLLI
jgi:hypothetical protein